jgi:transcriptional regulator GlxA family with amidase domain
MYDCRVVSVRGGIIMTADGRRARHAAAWYAQPDHDRYRDRAWRLCRRRRVPRPGVDQGAATSCAHVPASCSVWVGTFLLHEAGLLRGRRAATHWMHFGLLASRYSDIAVESDAIYVRDGAIWTSAGVTAGIDLALALIEQDCGRAVALHVARVLVVYLPRMGGQSQYRSLLASQVESANEAFADLERWISENLTVDLRVERLAERAGMSPRNFARRYAAERKRTPARAVESIRVDTARRALEETTDRIKDIAQRLRIQQRRAIARSVPEAPWNPAAGLSRPIRRRISAHGLCKVRSRTAERQG